MYFHTDSDLTISRLAEAVTRANAGGVSLRISVDSLGRLKFKVGGGMWSEAIDSTPDAFRDVPRQHPYWEIVPQWIHAHDGERCNSAGFTLRVNQDGVATCEAHALTVYHVTGKPRR